MVPLRQTDKADTSAKSSTRGGPERRGFPGEGVWAGDVDILLWVGDTAWWPNPVLAPIPYSEDMKRLFLIAWPNDFLKTIQIWGWGGKVTWQACLLLIWIPNVGPLTTQCRSALSGLGNTVCPTPPPRILLKIRLFLSPHHWCVF